MSLDASPKKGPGTADIAERGDDSGVTNDAGIGAAARSEGAWNLQDTSPSFLIHSSLYTKIMLCT